MGKPKKDGGDALLALIERLDAIRPAGNPPWRPSTVAEQRDYTMRVLKELLLLLIAGKRDARLDLPVHAINHLMLALHDLDATGEIAPILKPPPTRGGKKITTIAAQRRTLVKRCIDYIVERGEPVKEAAFEQVAQGAGVRKSAIKSDYVKITNDVSRQELEGMRALVTDDDLRGALNMLRELYGLR
jgi:hypothetical protein